MVYSLWLTPVQKLDDRLSLLISELAAEYASPIFRPHVTLLGGIDEPLPQVVEKVKKLVEHEKPFPVRLTKASYADSFFQCVFFEVEQSADLLKLNKKAQELFQKEETFRPHLSLLYGEHSEEDRKNLSEEIGELNQSFAAGKILIVDTSAQPQNWQVVDKLKIE